MLWMAAVRRRPFSRPQFAPQRLVGKPRTSTQRRRSNSLTAIGYRLKWVSAAVLVLGGASLLWPTLSSAKKE